MPSNKKRGAPQTRQHCQLPLGGVWSQLPVLDAGVTTMKRLLLLLIALFVALVTVVWLATDNHQQASIDQATTPEQLATALLNGGKSQVTFDHGVLLINRTVDAILTASTAVSGFNLIIARVVPTVFAKFPQVQSIVFRKRAVSRHQGQRVDRRNASDCIHPRRI